MKCLDLSHLHQYIDEELPAEVKLQVETHLKACPTCSERHKNLQHRSNTLKAMLNAPLGTPVSRPPLPAEIDGSFLVAETITPEKRLKRLLPYHWGYWVSAACLIGGVFLLQPTICQSQPREMLYMHQEILEVDANQPFEEQETGLILIDPSDNKQIKHN